MSQGNQHICPRGHTNFPGARFCSICGAPLTPDATIATQAASRSGLQTPKVPPSSPTQYGIPPEVQRYQEEAQWQIPLEYQYPLPDYLAGPQSVSSSTNQESVAPPPPQPQYIPLQPTIPVSQQSTPSIQPLLPQHPRQHLSRGKIFLLVGVVLTLIVASVVIFGAQAYTNHIANVNATATAQTDRNATATAVAKNILNATAVAKAAATATEVATFTNPYAHGGTLIQNDALSVTSNNWTSFHSSLGSCEYTNGGYTIHTNSARQDMFCVDQAAADLSSVTIEAKMKVVTGDCGGLITDDNGQGDWHDYEFYVCVTGPDAGSYYIYRAQGPGVSFKQLIAGPSLSIVTGLNAVNTLAVVQQGHSFEFFINNSQQPVDSFSDSAYPHGFVGVAAGAENDQTDAVFNNIRIWRM